MYKPSDGGVVSAEQSSGGGGFYFVLDPQMLDCAAYVQCVLEGFPECGATACIKETRTPQGNPRVVLGLRRVSKPSDAPQVANGWAALLTSVRSALYNVKNGRLTAADASALAECNTSFDVSLRAAVGAFDMCFH